MHSRGGLPKSSRLPVDRLGRGWLPRYLLTTRIVASTRDSRASTATLSKLAIEDVEGAAVYASDSAVTVTTLAATKVGMGLAAALGATLTATDLQLELPAAVGALAWGRSTVSVADARFASDLGLVACGGSSVREGAGGVVTARPRRRSCREEAMRDGWRKALTTASE